MNRRRFLMYLGDCIIIGVVLSLIQRPVGAETQPYRQFQKGMTYVWWGSDAYLTKGSDQSLQALAETGSNWVSLIVFWYQSSYTDSAIQPRRDPPSRTATDESLIHAIRTIHNLGLKVMLKPQIVFVVEGNYQNDRWRIQPNNVTAWFLSYRNFILHYAQLASSERVEQFCVGTEFTSMSKYTQYWYDVIDAVRRSYNGTLTYASLSDPSNDNWSEWKSIQFWDKLDYVGIDAYYSLTDKPDPTVAELRSAWNFHIAAIEDWQRWIHKPIIFTEIGLVSVAGANTGTWKWNFICNPGDTRYDPSKCKPDMQEQANLYEVALESVWNKSWFQGVFWWTWMPYGTGSGWGEGGPTDTNYSPHNKIAEQVLRSYYAKPFIPQGTNAVAVPALLAIQKAENATAHATREGRIMGLSQAQSLISNAIDSYNSGEYTTSENLANQAVQLALQATVPQTATSRLATGSTLMMPLQPVSNTGTDYTYPMIAVGIVALAVSAMVARRKRSKQG